MSIFRETSISWGGKDYTLVPSMALLRRIEAGNRTREVPPISLSRLVSDSSTGHPQLSLMMWVVETVMNHAGAHSFTDDVAYQEFHSSDTKAIMELWFAIVAALSPVPKEQKKADAPESA